MLRHGRKEICGVSLAWVGVDESDGDVDRLDLWISCKELRDRRLHHVDDVEKRAKKLNLRIRDSTVEEQILFKKQGTGTLQRKSSLLHSDDVFILIESCQSFPNINLMSPVFERKKRTKSTIQKAKKTETPKPTSHSNNDDDTSTAALPDLTETEIPSCDKHLDDHVISPPPSGQNQTNQHNPEPLKINGADQILDQRQSMSDSAVNGILPESPEHIPNEATENPYHRTLREGRKSPAQELTDDFNSKVKHAEQEHTAILENYVREAKKVAKKKKRLEQKKKTKKQPNNGFKIIANEKCSASQKTTSSPCSRPGTPDKRKRPRIRTDTLKSPNLKINHQGLISFSNEVKEKVGLAKVARREERERKQKEKRELEELVRLAKDILVEDHKKQTEGAKLTKLAEKELKMAEKMVKQKEKEAILLEKAAKSNAARQNNGIRKSYRRNSDKNLALPPAEAIKPLTARQKSLQESTKLKKQKTKPMPPPQTLPVHQKDTLPPPVLGTVTFLAGDKIIRRSPRKLPEAAVNAVDPATGVIPYSFACTIANTQGVIPHGLTERHFVSYRPAKKRASNHWCEELLNSLQRETSGNLQSSGSGRDSGLDSAEEEAIRRIFGEKKRETKRRSSPKKEGSSTGSHIENEGTPTKKLKKKTSTDGTSSGDSGRETPTSSEPKEISLKNLIPLTTGFQNSDITNMIDQRQLCIQSFCLTGYDYSDFD